MYIIQHKNGIDRFLVSSKKKLRKALLRNFGLLLTKGQIEGLKIDDYISVGNIIVLYIPFEDAIGIFRLCK